MKRIYYIILLSIVLVSIEGCSDVLDVTPQAILNEEQVTDPEKLVNAAYSILGNDHYDTPFSLWPYGNVRSDDAYKGGGGTADIQNFHFYEISTNITPEFGEPNGLWYNSYMAISRANAAINILNSVSEAEFPAKNTRIGEMKFLRGHFYFLLKILFKNIPYVDENSTVDAINATSNVALTNDELWGKIASDFEAAYDALPTFQKDKGRANKYAAAAYLAKVYLYKAYRQDEQHNLVGLDANDFNEVLKYTEVVMGSNYQLEPNFAYNFLPGNYENGMESIFAIQYSTDDGTKFGRVNFGDLLSVPMGLGCCDFHKPSQNLVNSFKTNNGLPQFDNYNASDYNMASDKSDPRLFHTVAMPDLPYKYNTNRIYKSEWNRNPAVYGYYASLKENVDPDCDCFVKMIPFYANSKNRIVIRYADVLLMRAEALIELGQEVEALPLINQVRARAKQSTGLVEYAANTNVTLYEDGLNCTWDKDFAREALRMERRLEFAMEGSRFFDLVRWGITDQVMNSYYQSESSKRSFLSGAIFTKNKNEYIPIPQQQINFSKGLYRQNYGW